MSRLRDVVRALEDDVPPLSPAARVRFVRLTRVNIAHHELVRRRDLAQSQVYPAAGAIDTGKLVRLHVGEQSTGCASTNPVYPAGMTEDAEHITVLDIEDGGALVRLLDTSEEIWSLASLPPGVQPGDTVAVRVVDGDMECWILPRSRGMQA
ncbi:hypothetical protein [Deinococcus wulumuqiensis]|nr:hypothetical protein [Deinococcus wulumuqiensis]